MPLSEPRRFCQQLSHELYQIALTQKDITVMNAILGIVTKINQSLNMLMKTEIYLIERGQHAFN